MEPTNTVPDISTAPKWSGDANYAWRDHWMQAVYFPRQAMRLQKGEPFAIRFSHDSLSLWFDLTTVPDEASSISSQRIERPVCECGLHYAWSRNRIVHLNSATYHSLVGNILKQAQVTLTTSPPQLPIDFIVVSDCTLLPLLLASSLCSRKVDRLINIFHIESSLCSVRFLQPIYNAVVMPQNVTIQLLESTKPLIELYQSKPTGQSSTVVLLAEPYTAASILPWDSLYFSF